MNRQIALVITDKETNAQIKNLGVGLLELRADLFKRLDPSYVVAQVKLRKKLKIPLLLTLRNQKQEGAVRIFPDALKWEIIEAAMPLTDMVDIELRSMLSERVVARAHHLKKKVIISSHFFKAMPQDLESVYTRSLNAGADIVKIAAKAGKFDDVWAMLAFTHAHRRDQLITMALGEKGAVSRLIFPAAGSLYTYSFLHKPTAPGQVQVMKLKEDLKAYSFSR